MPSVPAQVDAPGPRDRRAGGGAALPDAVIGADEAGAVTLWAGGAAAMFGLAAEEALGRPLSDVLPGVGAGAGSPRSVLARRRDGTAFPVDVSVSRASSDNATVTVAVVRDLGVDRDLALALARFRGAFDHAPIGMTLLTLDGRIARVNRAYARFIGYDEDELCGRHFHELSHPDEHEDDSTSFAALVAGRTPATRREKRYVRKDGMVVWGEVSGSVILGDDGAPLHVLGQIQDVTERRRTEQALARTNAELSHFAHMASHDLNEPLRIVDGFLHLLEQRVGDRLGEDGRRFVDHALTGTSRMRELITAFLQLAGSDDAPAEHTEIVLDRVAREAVAALGTAVAEHRVVVRVEDLPNACGDPALVRQVIQNLLGNAIRHARGDEPRVRVSGTLHGDVVELSVADNGPGVPTAERDRVFDLYAKSPTGGTGIGLAICRRIIARHGGRIWIQDAAEGGADVRFTLPAGACG